MATPILRLSSSCLMLSVTNPKICDMCRHLNVESAFLYVRYSVKLTSSATVILNEFEVLLDI